MNRRSLCHATVLAAGAIVLTGLQPSAYTLKGAKWNTSPVLFYVNTDNLDVDASALLEAVKFGAYAWTSQSNAAFGFYYGGSTSATSVTSNNKNEVFFRNASNGNAIATTYTYSSNGRILDTDIVFWDGAFQFFTGNTGCSGGLYIEDIAAHEFGHALGLGHSAVSGATMAPSISYCSMDARWLAEDDLQGVEALYPLQGSNSAPAVQIVTPSSGASFADGTSVSFSGSASDTEDGDLGPTLVWVSSRDGEIGTGQTFQRLLSVGTHTITARVTDSNGAVAEAQRSVTVEPIVSPTVEGGFTVKANGYKVKGLQRADLTWSGATSEFVDIYRDGARITITGNSGRYTDAINRKGAGAYVYVVCEAGTPTCSSPVTLKF